MAYLLKETKRLYDIEYRKTHPGKRRESGTEFARASRERNWLRIIEHLGGECSDCHRKFGRHVYDLHHVDPATKTGKLQIVWCWERILKYLVGCVLLCSNCHRERHFQMRKECSCRK